MFIDILRYDRAENASEGVVLTKPLYLKSLNLSQPERITVILKSIICGEEVMNLARTTSSKLHAGDDVQFQGEFESEDIKTFVANTFTIIKKWTERNPGKSFIPIPPSSR